MSDGANRTVCSSDEGDVYDLPGPHVDWVENSTARFSVRGAWGFGVWTGLTVDKVGMEAVLCCVSLDSVCFVPPVVAGSLVIVGLLLLDFADKLDLPDVDSMPTHSVLLHRTSSLRLDAIFSAGAVVRRCGWR